MAKRVFIVTDKIGRDNEELGGILMKNFLYSLARNVEKPKAVVFMNEGVRLVCNRSTSLDDLKLLEENGVVIKACGTCLDFLGLKDELAVGSAGTMSESVAALIADDVLTIG
ncbi:MAG TPA: sulfurtransferase-like selenium metabolism protein YedF [Coriobacteriia bacterium]